MAETIDARIIKLLETEGPKTVNELKIKLKRDSQYLEQRVRHLRSLDLITKINNHYGAGSQDKWLTPQTTTQPAESQGKFLVDVGPKGNYIPILNSDLCRMLTSKSVPVSFPVDPNELGTWGCEQYLMVLNMAGKIKFRENIEYDEAAAVAKLNAILESL